MSERGRICTTSPWAVPIGAARPAKDVAHQRERLLAEGQIEPILLLPSGDPDLDSWAYAREQIQAARDLGWTTILVTWDAA